MTMFTLQLKGFDELERKLKAFGGDIYAKHLRAANRAGANVIKKAVQDRAPVRTGLLKKNIIVFLRRESQRNRPTHTVGIKGKYKRYKRNEHNKRLGIAGGRYRVLGDAYYGRFVEYGTSKMRAQPFMRPAFMASYEQAIEAVRKRLASGVKTEWKKSGNV